MRNKRAKSFALVTLLLFLLLFREFCCWECDNALHAGILAFLGAGAGGKQDGGVVLVTRSAVVSVPSQPHPTVPTGLRHCVFS